MTGYGWVTFTTDYGLSDGFVASCHGVVARVAPDVRVIDVTHDVHPGDVPRAAAVLAQTVPHLPVAVHVAVVDPGVGTSRRGIAIETPNGVLVGPDNGLLLGAVDVLGGATRAVELTNQEWFLPEVSPTFHGRDIFAAVAARVALGADLAAAGPPVQIADLVRLPQPIVVVGEGYLEAEVLTVDRFGNVQLAVVGSDLDGLHGELRVGGMKLTRTLTFGEAPPGALVMYVDSAGYAALAINGGRAVVALSVSPGEVIRISEHVNQG
jgi:S-adenosylmethionine hydrolase